MNKRCFLRTAIDSARGVNPVTISTQRKVWGSIARWSVVLITLRNNLVPIPVRPNVHQVTGARPAAVYRGRGSACGNLTRLRCANSGCRVFFDTLRRSAANGNRPQWLRSTASFVDRGCWQSMVAFTAVRHSIVRAPMIRIWAVLQWRYLGVVELAPRTP